jgi:hypothetical protein
MATQTVLLNTATARRASQADGLFCAVSGVVFALGAEAMSSFSGIIPASIILALGLGLALYGSGAFYLASSRPLGRLLPQAMLIGNVAWIVGSLILLFVDPFPMTTAGRWMVLIIADVAGLFGIWQYIGLRRMSR